MVLSAKKGKKWSFVCVHFQNVLFLLNFKRLKSKCWLLVHFLSIAFLSNDFDMFFSLKSCSPSSTKGVCVKVRKQRMAFCNFPLAAAERCERVNVDGYAPRNMRNVIDRKAEINTYWSTLPVRSLSRCSLLCAMHAHVAQAPDPSSMQAPLFGLCVTVSIFFGQK